MDYNIHILLLEQAIIDNKKVEQVLFYVVNNLFIKEDYENIIKALNLVKNKNITINIIGLTVIFSWLMYIKKYKEANIILSEFITDHPSKCDIKFKNDPIIYKQELIKLYGCFWLS